MSTTREGEGTALSRRIIERLRSDDSYYVSDRTQTLRGHELLGIAWNVCRAIEARDDVPPIIPVRVGRSCLSVAAILGILLSGRAFSPLSAAQPPERLSKCMGSLGASWIIDGAAGASTGKGDNPSTALPYERLSVPSNASPEALTTGSKSKSGQTLSEHLAQFKTKDADQLYVLFTSGSTGQPKGVQCTYANVANTLLWSTDYITWDEGSVIGIATQLSFDIAMFDLFSSLYYGVPLYLFSEPQNPLLCLEEVDTGGITSVFSVPFFFSQFARGDLLPRIEQSALQRIVSGGDFFSPAHLVAWMDDAPSVDVFNVWGPTETSIVNTMHRVTAVDRPRLEQGRSASVGTSHRRMQVVLLDAASQTARLNETSEGEIAVLGASVSQGYLGDPQMTQASYFELDGKRGYRTGDLGHFEGDALYIDGRTDSRVKIAGHRIDLGEIENAATSGDDVFLCACFTHQSVPGIDEIWCAIQPSVTGQPVNIFRLKSFLRSILPAYMVPKRIFEVSRLPLNANGKVDRRAAKDHVVSRL